VLPPVLDKDLFLVCTGTGIAPFRSMVHHIKNHSIPYNNIYLIYGCRQKCDLLYYEELTSLGMKKFFYIPTLSREEWEGKHGYVHPVYELLAESKQPAMFYLCGWKNMIDEAKQRIMALGYDRKSIHQELYG
jgi:CDP-4-dehydro-6-deoxyglucose reductase